MDTVKEPISVTVSDNGDLVVSREKVAELGLQKGEQLLLLPLHSNQILLVKVDMLEDVSLEQISDMMSQSFQQAGYRTRDEIIQLVREVKTDMAQEW